jgi:hypothetical protein
LSRAATSATTDLAVNKLRSIWLSSVLLGLLGLLTSAGCEKSSDVGRMQEDATTMVKGYRPRIEELQRRSDLLMKRDRALTTALPGITEARKLLGEAKRRIDQLEGTLDAAPAAIQAGAKSGHAEELEKLMDELHAKLEDGIIESTSALAAVESWLGTAEATPAVHAPPPAPVPATDESPAPPPAGNGSAAPK